MKKAPATGQALGRVRSMKNNITLRIVRSFLVMLSKIGVIIVMSIPLLSLPYIINYKFILKGYANDSIDTIVAKITIAITFEFSLFFICAYLALWYTRTINTIAYYLKIKTSTDRIHHKNCAFTYYLPTLIFLHTTISLLWKSEIDYCWETIGIGTVVVNYFLIFEDDRELNWREMFRELKRWIKA